MLMVLFLCLLLAPLTVESLVHPAISQHRSCPRRHESDFSRFTHPRGGPRKSNVNDNNNDNDNDSKNQEISPPVYNDMDKALDVFENVYFYGTEEIVKIFRKEREAVLQNMTVKEVFLKYTVASGKGESGLFMLVSALRGAIADRVRKYYDAIKLSLEDRLDAISSIDLSGARESKVFENRRPMKIPTAANVFTATMARRNSKNETGRSLPLALVLGPSGSGKTFFALRDVAPAFLLNPKEKKVTIYLHTLDALVKFNNVTNDIAAYDLFAWIKKRIAVQFDIVIPDEKPLDMHICIVIDEAGIAQVKWWFENITMLRALCSAAKQMATSVAVVVAGTGLTANAISSSDDAYVFRMKPWHAGDLAMILTNYETSLNLVEGEETTETVADAVFSHPKLGALATNARSAYFLVNAIVQQSTYYNRLSWRFQLDEWTKSLVSDVVAQYMASNGISGLSNHQQRHVAASIFRALRKLKALDPKQPDLIEVTAGEIPVAESLLQYNCEQVDGRLQLLRGERFAFTVTPAIAIVLFAMAGVPATLAPGWKGMQELAALYAVQQWCIHCLETYHAERRHDIGSEDKLNQSLEQVRLIPLTTQVQSAKTKDDTILIPMVGAGAVLLNHNDEGSFANVIAPYMLIQAKREAISLTTEMTTIDLYEEMEKCSLLKTSGRDTRVLQGLMELWRGALEPPTTATYKLDVIDNGLLQQGKINRDPQDSDAFPANLLSLVPPIDPVPYAIIEGNDIVIGMEKHPLPPLDGTAITFMIATNVDKIRLKLSLTNMSSLTINNDNLDDDLEMNVDTLSDEADQMAWTRFVKDQVREGIVIKFLLTKSA